MSDSNSDFYNDNEDIITVDDIQNLVDRAVLSIFQAVHDINNNSGSEHMNSLTKKILDAHTIASMSIDKLIGIECATSEQDERIDNVSKKLTEAKERVVNLENELKLMNVELNSKIENALDDLEA